MISTDGNYYKAKFDPLKGGDCDLQNSGNFLHLKPGKINKK